MSLPPAAELIALVREQGPQALDQYAPEIDEYADMTALGAYFGVTAGTIRRERNRVRSDGPAWPKYEHMFGRSPVWRWRTAIVHRASGPYAGRQYPGSVPVPSDSENSE